MTPFLLLPLLLADASPEPKVSTVPVSIVSRCPRDLTVKFVLIPVGTAEAQAKRLRAEAPTEVLPARSKTRRQLRFEERLVIEGDTGEILQAWFTPRDPAGGTIEINKECSGVTVDAARPTLPSGSHSRR